MENIHDINKKRPKEPKSSLMEYVAANRADILEAASTYTTPGTLKKNTIEGEENKRIKEMGKRVKKARINAGHKTTQALSSAMGGIISQGTIARIERGDGKDIPIKNLITLAKTLGVSTDYLVGLTDHPTRNIKTRKIIEKFGLNEASLVTLNFLAASCDCGVSDERFEAIRAKYPGGRGEIPIFSHEATEADLYCNAERKKKCLAAINILLSWREREKCKTSEELLSRLYSFLNYDEKSGGDITFKTADDARGTLTPDKYLGVLLSILGDRLKDLRRAFWEGKIHDQKPTPDKGLPVVAFSGVPGKLPDDDSGFFETEGGENGQR
ncbi:MAG: helix-turn-helix domain-containing protein [Chitinispirillales bacterium]|nr:helix-turn-helix domain-containing protein [Chitinispirillales bacterium]